MIEYFNQVGEFYTSLVEANYKVQLILSGIVLLISILLFIGFAAKNKLLKSFLILFATVIAIVGALKTGEIILTLPYLFGLPSLLLSGIIYLISPYSNPNRENEHTVSFKTNIGKVYADISQHLAVFGSTGAGKTDSVFVAVIRHIFKYGLSSVVFDYKNGELWEKVLYFKKQQEESNIELAKKGKPTVDIPEHYAIYLSDPNRSAHFNLIDPNYLTDMEDVENISKTLFDNLYPGDGKDENFFKESASGAFAGTLWRFKEDFPEYCSFPYICAMLVNASSHELIYFISQSQKAKVLGAPFVDGAGNSKQLASVKSSISAAVKKLCTPKIFTITKKSDFNVAINDPEYLAIVGLINDPEYDEINLPIYATISRLFMNKCSKRGRPRSLWLWDEGSALKFNKFHRVLATLRTFKVNIIWGLQDKVQGELLYSLPQLKAILTNLGLIFMGKANDPDTGQYYSKMFETKDVKEKSYTQGRGGRSTSTSIREKAKYKPIEFRRLKQGQFFMIDTSGKDKKFRFKLVPYKNEPIPKVNSYTNEEIEYFYNSVFKKVDDLIEEMSDHAQQYFVSLAESQNKKPL